MFSQSAADRRSGPALAARQYRQQGGDFGEKKHIILTGHKDGKVLIWKLF
jgi:hypothetical protein